MRALQRAVKNGMTNFYRISVTTQTKKHTHDVLHHDELKNNFTKRPQISTFLAFFAA